MIEAILMKLGFSGMIAVALAATLVGGSVVVKYRLHRKDVKIESLTAQVREVAADRDRLANANRGLSEAIRSQNQAIEGYITAAKIQSQRVQKAEKDAKATRDQWNAYLDHLNQSIGNGDRDKGIKQVYGEVVDKWNRGDTAPSETNP